MYYGQFRRIAIGGLALLLAATPGLVAACGGFFGPANLAIDLNAFRVAFGVSDDHNMTEIVDVKYTGTADDFSWIMPLPGTPTVDVAQKNSLDVLQANTYPTVTYPTNYCSGLNKTQFGMGGGADEGGVVGTVGPYDYAIIKNDSPGQLIKWLRDNGYTIKAKDEPMIAQYVKEGNTFVAMKLRPDSGVQDIQPVVFRYQSTKITIPVRMGAIASTSTVPIQAWIFANSQYAPTNYARVDRPSLSAVRAGNETLIMGILDYGKGSVDPVTEYAKGVKAIQDKYQGHAFITEMAMKTADLPTVPDPYFGGPAITEAGSVITDMLSKYMYVTRLSAQLSPNQMTLDPLFAPVSGLPDVPRAIDLGQQVDPLTLYGCTTQAAIDPRIAAEFASTHTTFNALHFDVGHPANWQLSQFTVIPTFSYSPSDAGYTLQTIYAYSPQPVTAQTLDSYFKGGETPPMFVFTALTYVDIETFGHVYMSSPPAGVESPLGNLPTWFMLQALGRDNTKDRIAYNAVSASFQPYRASDGDRLVTYAILASKGQWQVNAVLFNDMVQYADGHQYYTDSATKDTLFLRVKIGNSVDHDVYELPIPNGWTSHWDTNHDILIDNGHGDVGPAMRLTLVASAVNPYPITSFSSYVSAAGAESDYEYPAVAVQRALSFYGLPGTAADTAITTATQQCALADNKPLQPAAFHSGGRTGLVLLTDEYIVGVYAPDADYATYQPTLQKMIDAYIGGYNCGAGMSKDGPTSAMTPAANASPAATAAICPKSPPPRLKVGGKGKVTPGAPDNLRDVPTASGAILDLIPPGKQFSIVSGPVCDPTSGLAWWQVTYGVKTGWIAEGQGTTYFVEPA